MNKTLAISGQTIELPFTEAEYQQTVDNFQSNHEQFPAKGLLFLVQDATHDVFSDSNHSDEHDLMCASLAIGLHLAEKSDDSGLIKQLEIDLLRDQNKALKAENAKLKQMVEELQELNSLLTRKQ